MSQSSKGKPESVPLPVETGESFRATGRNAVRTPIVPSQAPLICAAGFVVVVFLVAADEIFDIPFHVFGAPATPINWVEVGIEAFSILIVGVCTIAYVSRLGLKRRRAEKRVEHLNRVVRAARNVNQLIVRVKDREKLLHDVCESLIETRGYSSAWICLMDGSGEFSMGVEAGLGESFRALTEQLRGSAPVPCVEAAMARSGVVVADSSACFCQGCALGERDAGGMRFAVRLEHEGRIHGVLAVSCGADVTADEEEQSLLDEVAGDIAFALHNMDLAEDGKRTEEARRIAGRELAIRNRIAEVFLTVSDDEMYGEALPILLDAMESEYGVFGYIGETGALVVPSMTRHIWDKCQVSDKRFVFPRETWGNSTWPVAIREKRVICINEPSTLTPKGHIAITRHISLPLIHRGEVVGLIQVANKATDYSKADVALLETIGGAIAPVLDARLKQERQEAARKQAEEELRKHRDKLEVLVTQRTQELAESRQRLAKETAAVAEIVGEMLSGHLTDAETERQVLNACLGATNSVYGMIGVVNQHGRYDATTYGGRTLSDCAFPEALTWEITTGMEIRGIWGWPMIHGKPLLCNNLQDHPDRVGSPNGHVPIECFLGVPVRREGKVTGMVAVANKPGNYTEADVETLTRLVDVMSVSRQYRGLLTELEQRVHERTAQLEESNKELEAFSYSVSHDLRAPLRAIDGFSQILTEDYSDKLDDEGLRLLRVVQNSAHAMGRLIDDLLNFSRLSRKEMRTSEFDMGELAAEVFEGLRVAVPGRDVRLSVGSLPRAVGDRAMVRQVFVNLLSNAVKFTAPRETALIEVSGGREGNENAYCVKDNGVGFSMDYAGKLFRVFQRLHAAAEFEGTGIGLALVQRIIRRHGGRVWGEGKLNEGAAFYFTLPSKEATNG